MTLSKTGRVIAAGIIAGTITVAGVALVFVAKVLIAHYGG